MKRKKMSTKLCLNKTTITRLTPKEMLIGAAVKPGTETCGKEYSCVTCISVNTECYPNCTVPCPS